MTALTITQQIKAEAHRLGFSACGMARADAVDADHSEQFRSWLRQGGNADMAYMANYQPQRLDPRIMHPGTQSVISLALNYYPSQPLPPDTYQFAYYAYGQDYHDVMKRRLRQLVTYIKGLPCTSAQEPRLCTDTAPVLERYWAWRAGLGWIGRNHSLIIPGHGSFFILGEIFTDLDLTPDQPIDSQCGTCHRCTDICPCLAAPTFDASRCWSYQTIESKLPTSCSPQPTTYIYGCDRCQLVCPHNRHATPTPIPEFQPSTGFMQMTRSDWHDLTIEQYRDLFRGSAVKRAKYEKLKSTIDAVRRTLVAVILIFGLSLTASAQDILTWEQFVEDIYSQDDNATTDGQATDELLEELQYLHDHPINLNATNAEQLKALPFLDDTQIHDILAYIDTNAPMLSLGELMLIYSLNLPTRQKLMLFCYAGEMQQKDSSRLTLRKVLDYSKNELTLRTDIPFYTKAGYRDYSDSILLKSPNKQYRGDRMYRSLRYSFSSLGHVDAGVNIEKDAGEKDFDYLSAYVYLHQLGRVKTLALGDYKVSFGQGLVVNSSMGFGKTMMLSGLSNMDKGITRHSSMSENNHFRGAATTLSLSKSLVLSAFASYTDLDGTLDSTAILTSWKTDGLHRTPGDNNKKGVVGNTTLGSNIRWEGFHGKVRLGLTGIYSHLSKELRPKCDTQSTLYRLYNLHGTDFSAYSLAYSYISRRLLFRGETALNHDGACATVNSLQLSPNSYNRFLLIQRFYSYRYATLYGKSFGENSTPQNESGLFVGWNGSLLPKVKFDAYLDGFYFPYMKYQVSDASRGWEGQVQATYTPTKATTLTLRYRIKSKQKDYKVETDDDTDPYTVLAYYTNQSLRLQYSQELNPHLSSKATLSGVYNYLPSGEADTGYLLSEALRWTGSHKEKIDLAVSYFHTDNYSARVYAYEPGLLYAYGMTSYFYHGLRALLSASLPLTDGLTLRAKLATTHYFDRSTIGTAQETIEASHKEDLQIQLRWVF